MSSCITPVSLEGSTVVFTIGHECVGVCPWVAVYVFVVGAKIRELQLQNYVAANFTFAAENVCLQNLQETR